MAVYSLFTHESAPVGASVIDNETDTDVLGVVVRPDASGHFTSIWYFVGAAGLGAIPAKAHVYSYRSLGLVPNGEEPYITENFNLRDTQGWQEIELSVPVEVIAGTRYMVSVSFPSTGAYYTATAGVFSADLISGLLTAESQSAVGNGRYADNGSDELTRQYPHKNWSSTSYGVDVTFDSGWEVPGITHYRIVENGDPVPLDVTILS